MKRRLLYSSIFSVALALVKALVDWRVNGVFPAAFLIILYIFLYFIASYVVALELDEYKERTEKRGEKLMSVKSMIFIVVAVGSIIAAHESEVWFAIPLWGYGIAVILIFLVSAVVNRFKRVTGADLS